MDVVNWNVSVTSSLSRTIDLVPRTMSPNPAWPPVAAGVPLARDARRPARHTAVLAAALAAPRAAPGLGALVVRARRVVPAPAVDAGGLRVAVPGRAARRAPAAGRDHPRPHRVR